MGNADGCILWLTVVWGTSVLLCSVLFHSSYMWNIKQRHWLLRFSAPHPEALWFHLFEFVSRARGWCWTIIHFQFVIGFIHFRTIEAVLRLVITCFHFHCLFLSFWWIPICTWCLTVMLFNNNIVYCFLWCWQNDELVTGGDSTSEVSVSCSSTDDTASVGPSSSSLEGSQGLECSWSPVEGIQTAATISAGLDSGGGGGGGIVGEAEEEAKDRVTEVPRRPRLFRNSIRSLSPLRRHSWGPGKNNGGDAEMNQRRWVWEGN